MRQADACIHPSAKPETGKFQNSWKNAGSTAVKTLSKSGREGMSNTSDQRDCTGSQPVRIYGTGGRRPFKIRSGGPLHGYQNIREALEDLQDGRCLLCGEHTIEHDHPLIPKSKGGSNTLANMAGLCENCHTLVHTDQAAAEKLAALKAGQNKKYRALSVLNQIIPYLVEILSKKFHGNLRLVSGWETKKFRDENHIDKDHDVDAYCIAVLGLNPKVIDVPETHFQFRQYDKVLYQNRECFIWGRRKSGYFTLKTSDGKIHP